MSIRRATNKDVILIDKSMKNAKFIYRIDIIFNIN